MGCDIHLHIEIKVAGRWEHLHAPNVQRDYRLFAIMAGVRNYGDEIKPISKPKGLPDALSVVTKLDVDRYGIDGHSHSWLGAEEIADLEKRVEVLGPGKFGHGMDLEWDILNAYLFSNSFGGFAKYPNERPAGVEDLRFVFWFDN